MLLGLKEDGPITGGGGGGFKSGSFGALICLEIIALFDSICVGVT